MSTHDPGFTPSFCPWPECLAHRDREAFVWRPHGVFRRKALPRVIRRFRCLVCRRTFSTQTFDTTYFLKRPDLQAPLFEAMQTCAGFRQLAHAWRVSHSTLQRQASRLGRHCLLFERTRGPSGPPSEPLAMDGFVTFEFSQYWPFEINVLVGMESRYVFGFTESALRRSGRMTERQKAKRARLEARHGKPEPEATRKAIEDLIRLVAPEPVPLKILSDEHLAYPRAIRRLPHAIEHQTITSRRCRTARNPLWIIDHLDLMTRHRGANHKRETIAFSKRRQGALERYAVLIVWTNHTRGIRVNEPWSPTPAQNLGLADRALTAEDILERRLFWSHVPLPPPWRRIYWRDVDTRQIPGTRHDLKWAA